MKRVVLSAVWLMSLLFSVMCQAQVADATVFAFSSNRFEQAVADSIRSHYDMKTHEGALNVVPIIVNNGKINDAVQKFEHYIDSVGARSSNFSYDIIGIGTLGSAAATISASGTDPQKLILISGVGIDGVDLLYRMFSVTTYLLDMPYATARSLREEFREEINNQKPLSKVPEMLRELAAYQPSQYLQKIKCPVYAVFGTSDSVVEWYANCVGMESALPNSEHNSIRVHSDVGYCLKESKDNPGLPMIGDMNPKAEVKINTLAVDGIVDWMIGKKQ